MMLTDNQSLKSRFLTFAPVFLFCLIATLSVQAQQSNSQPENYCGVQMTEAEKDWLRSFQANPPADVLERSGAVDYYVPMQMHITGNDEGGGYYRLENLFTQLCELNDHFAATGFYFYIDGDINYIDNQIFHSHDFSAGYDMMNTHNVDGRVNMYMVDDPAGNCGYYSGWGNAMAVAQTCASPGSTTMAHELGHYFNLPHTFSGWEGGDPPPVSQQEKVDGTNCNSAADGFCDTPPDYASYRWNCPTTGPFTDPNGVSFVPDGTYYMSYSNDACTDKFSPMQSGAMTASLTGPRSELLASGVVPGMLETDTIVQVEPANGSLDLPYNYIVVKWEKDPNATSYHVAVGYNALLTALVADVIVEDTFFILTDLPIDRKLHWKVKGLSQGNTCSPYSEIFNFRTGSIASAIDAPNATNDEINIFPNPVGATQILNIQFETSNMHEANLQVTDLSGRMLFESTQQLLAGANSIELSTADFASGMYLLTVQGEGFSGSKTFVVNK